MPAHDRLLSFTVGFLLAAVSVTAQAARFEGVVTHITDGDSVWVRPATGGAPVEIRLEGIDAPEICQRFGVQARNALTRRVLQQRVTVETRSRDGFNRTLARVRVDREDLGGWMVAHGYAWSYRFRRDRGPYAAEEARARKANLGLWSAGAAVPPRDFRRQHGACNSPG